MLTTINMQYLLRPTLPYWMLYLPLAILTCPSLKWLLFTPSSKLPNDTTDNSTWHLQEKHEFKLLTNFTIRLTNEMLALSRRSESRKPVWSGWKEIIGGFISPIQCRNCWQLRQCRVSRFWCTKSGSSLPCISSPSTLKTLELCISLSLLSLSLFLHLLIITVSLSRSLSVAEDDERLESKQS